MSLQGFSEGHHTNGDQTHIAVGDSLPCLDRHREFRAEAPWTKESGYDSFATVSFGQKRLGPKNRDTILNSTLDPSFASTSLNRLIFLPFVNELDYPEGAMILAENFIGAMRQKHPNITILAPLGAKQLIQDQKLGDDYRAFMGNYANTGVATMSFLAALSQNGQFDGILLGRILGFGVINQTTVFGGFSWSKNKE